MKNTVVGIMAHVDAGKTTLTEAMMLFSGKIREAGRVDAGSAHLDFDPIERARGITIYSALTEIETEKAHITVLDTPGHAELLPETERAMSVMDCAVLVINGTSGPEAHTGALWKMAMAYHLPVFIFVTKMDIGTADRERIMRALRDEISPRCIELSGKGAMEEAALTDENALAEYLEDATLGEATLSRLFRQRRIFPCCFGSGLRMQGIGEFIDMIASYAPQAAEKPSFAARVYKIARDERGQRLTYLKLTGGTLSSRDRIDYTDGSGDLVSEKIQEIRCVSGGRYTKADVAVPGRIYAVTGLSSTYAPMGLGCEDTVPRMGAESVFRFRVKSAPGTDARALRDALAVLTEEEPSLAASFDPALREFRVGLTGDIEAEVFTSVLARRFGISATLDAGRIFYKETVASPVYGAGHFEPLRHYAEVRVLVEPAARGSGIIIHSALDTDTLDAAYQAQILSSLRRKRHIGTLTGSPLTDVTLTLVAGRAHIKHTEGGDFYEAASRAVRAALMQADMVLLEPYFDFEITLEQALSGRAAADILRMGGRAETDTRGDGLAVIHGAAPAATLSAYARELGAYTRGQGRISLFQAGYEPVADPCAVRDAFAYDAERDTENPADSVFTDHGGSITVRFDEAERFMHTESVGRVRGGGERIPSKVSDKELEAIMLRAMGPVRRAQYGSVKTNAPEPAAVYQNQGTVKLIYVDAYNLLFAWDELKALAEDDLESARLALLDILSEYSAFTGVPLVAVFDAYRTDKGASQAQQYKGISVVFTKKDEPADVYISKALAQQDGDYLSRVITSDNLIKLSALESRALMTGSADFRREVENALAKVKEIIRLRRAKSTAAIGEQARLTKK